MRKAVLKWLILGLAIVVVLALVIGSFFVRKIDQTSGTDLRLTAIEGSVELNDSEGETFSLTSSTGVGTLQIDGNAKEYVVLSIKESVAFDDLVPTDAHKFILQVEVSANES